MVTCRLCLFEIENSYGVYNLFSPLVQTNTNMKDTLALSVMQFVPINIALHDGLPETICSNCYDDLTSAYQFYQTCINADESLRGDPMNQPLEKVLNCENSFAFGDNNVNAEPPAVKNNQQADEFFKLNSLEKLTCNICLKKFKHHGRYVLHMQRHNANVAKPDTREPKHRPKAIKMQVCTCKICFKSFQTSKALERHKEKHSIYNIFTHTKSVPSKKVSQRSQVFKCTHCSLILSTIRKFNSHLRKIHGVEPNPRRLKVKPKDDIVDDETHSSRGIKKKQVSRLPASHLCTFCDEKFTSFTRLKKHMKMHLQSPLFQCKECDKGFGSLKKLNEHANAHT